MIASKALSRVVPTLVLCLAALCGCASTPQCPPAVMPVVQKAPPTGYFQSKLEEILRRGQTSAPSSAP